ncbi:hydrogenase 4 subunit F [Candidatus Uhrbacteria bacterium]|nr:hydrogenase 4 subunit F [Candidatus Uhrbacteria bacterium]
MHPFILFVLLLGTAAITALPQLSDRLRNRISGFGGLLGAAAGIAVALPVLSGSSGSVWVDEWLLMDRAAAFLLVLVMIVYAAATVASGVYLQRERSSGAITERRARLYCVLLHVFVATMVAAALANNIVVLWIALEATTLSTTLLVAFRRTTGSVEAAWKYIVLCSTGITLGLLGVLMMSYAGKSTGALVGGDAFLLHALREHATGLAPAAVRWAFVFLFVGIGTKVGLAPMHSWLPDAHSKTPSPISALLSGVLLNVAFLVLLRFKVIADLAFGSATWTNGFFLGFGILSIAIPALTLLTQRNYKRMLGYSSIEHMGILAFAVGLGPFGMIPAVMHMAGHALAKPLLFLGAGEFLHRWQSTLISDVQGTMGRMPRTAALFFGGLLALLAVPPSALFVSEFMIVGYGITQHPVWTVLVLVLLTIACVAMMRIGVGMVFGKPPQDGDTEVQSEPYQRMHAVLAVQLIGVVALGLWFTTSSGFAFAASIANDLIARV